MLFPTDQDPRRPRDETPQPHLNVSHSPIYCHQGYYRAAGSHMLIDLGREGKCVNGVSPDKQMVKILSCMKPRAKIGEPDGLMV